MKIAEAFQPKPRVDRDARTGEVIKPCVGVKHWWFYRTASVQECKHCGQFRLVQR
jgi:hypothetical protein